MTMPFPYHFAVVVGIDHYPGVSRLYSPVEDAKAFEEWLLTDGGVPKGNIFTILGNVEPPDKFAAKPQRDEIITGFRRIHKMIEEALEADPAIWYKSRLYVFLSGHGTAPTGSEVAFLAADAGGDAWPHIACRKYIDFYDRTQYFQDVVVFADCCRSAKDIEPEGPSFEKNPEYKQMGPRRTVVGYATGDSKPAYEPPFPWATGRKLSYFTEALLEGLRGANTANTGAAVTDKTVADYVMKIVPERHPNQNPNIIPNSSAPVVFRAGNIKPSVETLFTVTIIPPPGFLQALELWYNAQQLVTQWPANGGEWKIALAPGTYEVRPAGQLDGTSFAKDGFFKIYTDGQHAQL